MPQNPHNKGKMKASASASAPQESQKWYPTLPPPPAWLVSKEKKDRAEEEAWIATRDLNPPPTAPPSSTSTMKTVIKCPATPEVYATQVQRQLRFREREYDRDCISKPQWQSENNNNEDNASQVESESDYKMVGYDQKGHEIEMIRDDIKSNLKKLQNDKLSQLAVHLRAVQMVDAMILQQRADDLAKRNQKPETIVEKLLVEGKNVQEEKKRVAATEVVILPANPRKDILIWLAPPKSLTQVVTPLAQQFLKRNMAKRKEQSGGEAIDIDTNNNSAQITGRPVKKWRSEMIRGEGTNSARPRSPSRIEEKRVNVEEAKGTLRKEKMKQCGKKFVDGGD
ncbi:hypothetical protein BDD12DRAFT_890648 [Trichophaea hybrida]|nr:hypothetical protein BDD12DRAFT_890648 [Trichophaea hybrida]